MQLRERGWSIAPAAREVGVSRTAGNNWSRGYKVYRKGQVVRFVSPLDRLAAREISPRYLSQDERVAIADLRHAGLIIRQIAQQIRTWRVDGLPRVAPQRQHPRRLSAVRRAPQGHAQAVA
jgi:transposase, IS30 family